MNEVSPEPVRDTIAARRSIEDMLAVSGRQVPAELVGRATLLLADIWMAGVEHGVKPADWRGVANLPMECVDVLTMAGRRQS
jgi:hypothetical protein